MKLSKQNNKELGMRIAYIAHPISGDIKGNLEKIKQIIREINLTEPDILPFAHYWVDCHALDDNNPAERERGIKNDKEFFNRKSFDELRLYGEKISGGMRAEIDLALLNNIPIKPMTEETRIGFETIMKGFTHVRQIPQE